MSSKGPRKPSAYDYYGGNAGWLRAFTQTYPITKNDTVSNDPDGYMSNDELSQFEPPLRGIISAAGGTVVFCCHNDDETDPTKKTTVTLTAGVPYTTDAIRKIFATGTTMTDLLGKR